MRSLRYLFLALGFATLVPSMAQAEDRRLTLVNKSGQALYNLYASNSASNDWSDLFGRSDVVISGVERTLHLSGGAGSCSLDLKAVFKDGRTLTARGVDVCKAPKWVFDSSGSGELVYDNFKASSEQGAADPGPSADRDDAQSETGGTAAHSAADTQFANEMAICRAWAKVNVQVFETDVSLWKQFYTDAANVLKARGFTADEIIERDGRANDLMQQLHDDEIGLYLNFLTLGGDEGARKMRSESEFMKSMDHDCPRELASAR